MSAEHQLGIGYMREPGYGRTHFARCIAEHANLLGYNVEFIDTAALLNPVERFGLDAAYDVLSEHPWAYKPARQVIDGSGPKTVNINKLNERITPGRWVISVSPITAEILSKGDGRVFQMVSDRAVQRSDVAKNVQHIAVASDTIDNFHFVGNRSVSILDGVAQPVALSLMNRDERRRQMELDGQPIVLFSVNGHGDMGLINKVVYELASLVQEEKIRLALFVGHHDKEKAKAESAATRAGIPIEYHTTYIEAKAGTIFAYGSPNREETILLRMKVMGDAHAILPATTMELTNVCLPVIDPGIRRNVVENANSTHAQRNGWAVPMEGNLGTLIEELFTPDQSRQTLAQRLFAQAFRFNDPEAGTRLVQAFVQTIEQG